MVSTLITLTTDFGLRDPYVASMKGVLLSACPGARIHDLTHDLPPQDVFEGALYLAGAIPWFPADTIHVAVVDPGVGTDRRAIIARVCGQYLICPDNGLLTVLARQQGIDSVHTIQNLAFMRPEISATFHGRDIFAPAAAHIALGARPEDAGEEVKAPVMLEWPEPVMLAGGRVEGAVVHVDRFGNIITNLHFDLFSDRPIVEVILCTRTVTAIRRIYAEAAEGELLALFGSTGLLEVAVNGGSAAKRLSARRGDKVEVIIQA